MQFNSEINDKIPLKTLTYMENLKLVFFKHPMDQREIEWKLKNT